MHKFIHSSIDEIHNVHAPLHDAIVWSSMSSISNYKANAKKLRIDSCNAWSLVFLNTIINFSFKVLKYSNYPLKQKYCYIYEPQLTKQNDCVGAYRIRVQISQTWQPTTCDVRWYLSSILMKSVIVNIPAKQEYSTVTCNWLQAFRPTQKCAKKNEAGYAVQALGNESSLVSPYQ